MNHFLRRLGFGWITGFALSLLASNSLADTVSLSNSLYASSSFADSTQSPDAWRFTLGAGVVDMPAYPGASRQQTNAIPVIGASYGRYFIGANPDAGALLGLGGYFLRNNDWRVGAALTYDFIEPRKESDDLRLHGLGDIDRTSHAELFAIYSMDWLDVRGSVQTDLGGNDRGTIATLDAIGKYQATPNLALTAGPGLTWGSSDYNETFFGVDEAQSIDSGLPRYSAGSGLNALRFSLGASYRLATHWSLGANITATWLQGDSADSPIVEKKTQMSYGAFVNYLF